MGPIGPIGLIKISTTGGVRRERYAVIWVAAYLFVSVGIRVGLRLKRTSLRPMLLLEHEVVGDDA